MTFAPRVVEPSSRAIEFGPEIKRYRVFGLAQPTMTIAALSAADAEACYRAVYGLVGPYAHIGVVVRVLED